MRSIYCLLLLLFTALLFTALLFTALLFTALLQTSLREKNDHFGCVSIITCVLDVILLMSTISQSK